MRKKAKKRQLWWRGPLRSLSPMPASMLPNLPSRWPSLRRVCQVRAAARAAGKKLARLRARRAEHWVAAGIEVPSAALLLGYRAKGHAQPSSSCGEQRHEPVASALHDG